MTPAAAKSPASSRTIMTAADIDAALRRIADAFVAQFPDASTLAVLGIRTRGVVLADRLRKLIEARCGESVDGGVLDITLYRDDVVALGPQPMVRDSAIDFDVTDRNILLVDDVLYTGRTIRAAMEEIIDFGRPGRIRLAVLVDRGLREYPIQADFAGLAVDTRADEAVRVLLSEIDGRDEVVVERR